MVVEKLACCDIFKLHYVFWRLSLLPFLRNSWVLCRVHRRDSGLYKTTFDEVWWLDKLHLPRCCWFDSPGHAEKLVSVRFLMYLYHFRTCFGFTSKLFSWFFETASDRSEFWLLVCVCALAYAVCHQIYNYGVLWKEVFYTIPISSDSTKPSKSLFESAQKRGLSESCG